MNLLIWNLYWPVDWTGFYNYTLNRYTYYWGRDAVPSLDLAAAEDDGQDDEDEVRNTGFLNICGLALSGGLAVDLEGSSGRPLACSGGGGSGLLYFFNVHWFCLAKRSAAVLMSGLTGSEAANAAEDPPPPSAACCAGTAGTPSPTPVDLTGKSMTRSGAPPEPFKSVYWCRAAGIGFGRSIDPCESALFRHSWILWSNESSPMLRLLACVLHREPSLSPPPPPLQSADLDRLWCSRTATGGGDDGTPAVVRSPRRRRPPSMNALLQPVTMGGSWLSCCGDCSSTTESLPESRLSVLPICKNVTHRHAHEPNCL